MLFKKIVLVVFLMALFITTPKNFTIATNNPGEYVMSITKDAISKLTDSAVDQAKKESQFGELFDKNFDVPSISRFVLGKYWKQATLDQKKNFIKAFRNYVVKTYSSRFNDARYKWIRSSKDPQTQPVAPSHSSYYGYSSW